jgi:hypothetical protein
MLARKVLRSDLQDINANLSEHDLENEGGESALPGKLAEGEITYLA